MIPRMDVMQLVEVTPPDQGETTRMARFQSLAAGQFWRAKAEVPEEGIARGMVLGIISIKWVDEKQHTVVLQAHPSLIGTEGTIVTTDDGGKRRTHYVRFDEHRFLTADFLAKFEFEPNAAEVRRIEIDGAQAEVQRLQRELSEGRRNPQMAEQMLLESRVAAPKKQKRGGEDVEPAIAPLTPEAEAEAQRAFGDGTIVNSIGSGLTVEAIASIRQSAARQAHLATVQAQFITAKTTAIAEACKAIAPYYAEQGAMALAGIEDVMRTVKDIQQGVASLDLYVGTGVIVNTIAEGASAPRDVKLTICQRKLFMDEELSVHSDVDETFDADDTPRFVEALRTQPSLVAQIFPTARCVLCMQTTRRVIDYGSDAANLTAALNGTYAQNEAVFLLIRDGENVRQVWSDVEGHLGTDNLFPSKVQHRKIFESKHPFSWAHEEVTQSYREPDPFEGIDGSTIKFGDVAYTDRLEAHERFALHYKRFLILLCGLDHRLKAMGPFYEGPQSMDFVSMAFQRAHFHFLHDEDGEGMLPGQDRLPIRKWVEASNAAVRSGSRIVADWTELSDHESAPGACKYDASSLRRSYWRTASLVQTSGVATVAMDAGELVVPMPVENRDREKKRFNARVSLSRYRPERHNNGWMGYLCLDTVDPFELRGYLGDRCQREHFLQYVRVFKTALRTLDADRAAEAPVRARMLLALQDGRIADGAEAQAVVDQAVQAWRADHRGAALPTLAALETATHWKALLDLMFMICGGASSRVADVLKFFQDRRYQVLRLTTDSRSRLIAYVEPLPAERDDRLEPHIWVHRVIVKAGKTSISETSRKWVVLGAVPGGETLVEEWSGAKAWLGLASRFSSVAEKRGIFDRVENLADGAQRLMEFGDPLHNDEDLRLWDKAGYALTGHRGFVTHAPLFVPFGVFVSGETLAYIGVGSDVVAQILHAKGNARQQAAVEDAYVGRYNRKYADEFRQRFKSVLKQKRWDLMTVNVDRQLAAGVMLRDLGEATREVREGRAVDPLVSTTLEPWNRSLGKDSYWLLPEVAEDPTVLDRFFGLERPVDFAPVAVNCMSITAPFQCEVIDIGVAPGEPLHDVFHAIGATSMTGGYSNLELVNAQAVGEYLEDALTPRVDDPIAHRVLVAAGERPDLPQPPAGVERWYVSPPPKHRPT